MYSCKIFVLFVYILATLSTVECVGSKTRNGSGGDGQGKTKSNSEGSGSLSGNAQQGDQSSGGESEGAAVKTVAESPLDLNDLKSDTDKGFYYEYDLDDWKIKWYRSFVGKNYNKLKHNNKDLWPETVTHQSIYELLVFNKDKKFLVSVTTLKPDAYLSTSYFHYEEQGSSSSGNGVEYLDRDNFMTKFQQILDSKFIPPFPNRLPKDLFYQKYTLFKAKSSDPSAGPDLDIL